ncbi:MAG TPA: hypothetical protein ENN13_03990 [Candidatus Altiarchaeales archaeon]|nr:hypothetical protein [Candidatus Altiarchaeales archaeon]
MSVVNFQVKKIACEKSGKRAKSIEVNAASNIDSMKKEHDPRIGDYIAVNFKYDVKYEPDVGSISLEGSLWYYAKNFDEMVSEEKDKIELKKDAVVEITNALVQDCLLEALDLSRKIQLPPPLKLPKVDVKPEKLSFAKAS